MRDTLQEWMTVRDSFDWHNHGIDTPPLTGKHDGHLRYIQEFVRESGQAKAVQLLKAIQQVRIDAKEQTQISFELLCGWQRIVLDCEFVTFRNAPAFAKQGREYYGFDETTEQLFNQCLLQSNQSTLPLTSVATRAYFDVCFFHPFLDGNARSATLVLAFLLGRAHISLDEVRPLFMVSRSASVSGVRNYLRVLHAVMEGTRKRVHLIHSSQD
ncbi:MAG: Fic family protein [Candidatus Obscuribacterales bacterium]|nr:Fic family protein [Candidatus Obscuribacterales bacterium]